MEDYVLFSILRGLRVGVKAWIYKIIVKGYGAAEVPIEFVMAWL